MACEGNSYQSTEIDKLLDTIDSRIEALQNRMVETAGYLGFIKETFRDSRQLWNSFRKSGTVTSDSQYYLASTAGVLRAILTEFDAVESDVSFVHERIAGVAGSSTVFASGMNAFTSITGSSEIIKPTILIYSALDKYQRHKEYEARFRNIDATLGRTYGELIEVIHATAKDPTRSAMFLARQLFDHFFDVIAPDEDVRSSQFWRPKLTNESKDPNAVWKNERLSFAAFSRVKDQFRKQTLEAMSKQTIDLYQLLNIAHTRGPINEAQSSHAVESMIRLLQQWIDSI